MKKSILICIALIIGLSLSWGQVRMQVTLEKGWKFTREDNSLASEATFDDSSWQSVRVPHDWAIYGPFDKQNDIHRMAIVQDGQTTAIEHYGRTGGLPFTGVGWYRNRFSIPDFSKDKRVTIQFDGAMSNARVYVNGKEAGNWPNGYNSFYFDITELLNSDGKDNILAVRLENFNEQSRWYPGAGLYRNVHLITTSDTHIPIWGTHVTTPEVTEDFARVQVETKVKWGSGLGDDDFLKLKTSILDPQGKVVAESENELPRYGGDDVLQTLIVANPQRWDIKQPNLYKVRSELSRVERKVKAAHSTTTSEEIAYPVDNMTTTFGIRTLEVRADEGFFLNGRKIKFQGAC
ncbi:MAG: beta galactosidase jelly roll domain-containing protein, partial [Proteiniphilum sp.]|nr:beta galactosidase jelly roll domain-containing protein [Proteiniphilum sp.]